MTLRDRAIRIVDLGRYDKKTDEQIVDKILDLIESELLDEKSFRSLSSSMEQNKWHRLGFLEIIDLIKTKLREGR